MKLKNPEQLHEISPHIETSRTSRKIMQDVVIALMPAFLVYYQSIYGKKLGKKS